MLRELGQGGFVTATPSFQEIRDFRAAYVAGFHNPRRYQKCIGTVAGFGRLLPPILADGDLSFNTISARKLEKPMKYLTTIALANLAIASVYAQRPVDMVFSGTSAPSTVNLLQPNSQNDEDNFTGSGTLGRFTFRNIRAIENSPSPSSTCSGTNQVFFNDPSGAGIFRFEDGSLLFVSLVQGGDCIDFAAGLAHCALTFKITGGTGQLQNASGSLTFTETSVPVLSDASNNPVYFAAAGGFTGTISVAAIEPSQDARH